MPESDLQRISDRILYLPADHRNDRPILAAISGEKRTLLMDAGNSAAHAELFLRELAPYALPRIELLALTHWHWDHVFGTTQMNLPTVAHVETKRRMEAMAALEWTDEALKERVRLGQESSFIADHIRKEYPGERDIVISLPTLLFEQHREFDLGGLTCRIEHVGGDHTPDSCVLYVQEEKTLFLGDCMGPALLPYRYYTSGKMLSLLDRLESYDAELYVPSHGEPMTKADMQTELWEMRSLMRITHDCAGRKEEIVPEVVKQWGRELNPGDDPFIDWFIAGFHLEQRVQPVPS
jgi:glyoxylase-like metal-dependent hydrolase (beta-lactamase superfamily II)